MSRMFSQRRAPLDRSSSTQDLLHSNSQHDRRFSQRLDPERTGLVAMPRLLALFREAGIDPTCRLVQSEIAALTNGKHETSVPLKVLKAIASAPATDSVLQKLLTNRLAIPSFAQFCQDLVGIFESVRPDNEGALADYIPELAEVDPEKFAFAVATVDGQLFAYGDTEDQFCIQSCGKPFVYAMACDEHGLNEVHKHVGREPSGVAFNNFSLNKNNQPHNPLINSGAFITHSLVRPNLRASQRMSYVLGKFSDLAAGVKIGFDQPTYLSERETANKNFALAYYMKSQGALPIDWDVQANLEVRPVLRAAPPVADCGRDPNTGAAASLIACGLGRSSTSRFARPC